MKRRYVMVDLIVLFVFFKKNPKTRFRVFFKSRLFLARVHGRCDGPSGCKAAFSQVEKNIHGPKPVKFIRIGDIYGPKPFKLYGLVTHMAPNAQVGAEACLGQARC